MREDIDAEILKHNLSLDVVHTNLQSDRCICMSARVSRPGPRSSGNACVECGGLTVQTGTCTTCTECGTSGGCG